MKKGFSLIELLVGIIVMSLLLAAFMPLITKKLKASDITVGSFGGGGGAIGVKRNVTKQDCDKLNAVFVEASANVPKPLCVLKYNIGDMGNENWAGVQRCEAGKDCTVKNGDNKKAEKDDLQPTCWQGTTSTIGSCDAEHGGYSGCYRTLCNWTGANQMCSNYSLKSTSGWRLPTFEELTSFTNDKYTNAKLASNGLMMCDISSSSNSPQCYHRNENCLGTCDGDCNPYHVWSSSFDSLTTVQDRYLSGSWNDSSYSLGYAYSARCVLDSISDVVPPDGGTDLIDNKLDSQADCDKLGAGLLFVSKEDTGTKNMCVMKYNIGDTGVENWAGVQKCSSKGTCTVANRNSTTITTDELTPTCWQGETANKSYCNSACGGYSGCTRTVCNWTGANKLCENYRLGTYGWRLPEIGELTALTSDKFSSKKLGSKGLMFCEQLYNSELAPVCMYVDNACFGSRDGATQHCDPSFVWSKTNNTDRTGAQRRNLNNGWQESGYSLLNAAGFSARCVLDEDAFKHANTNQVMPTETEISNNCEDSGCALCANDKCYACKHGYEFNGNTCKNINHCTAMNNNYCTACEKDYVLLNGKCLECNPSNGFVKVGNLCVMQYNIGDGYYRESWKDVQRCIAGQNCGVQNAKKVDVKENELQPTCWIGTTSENCKGDFGNYSGCTRTICNWTGAKKMCSNIGWKLPTLNELITFTESAYSNIDLGSKGLMFCNLSATSDPPICPYLENGCLDTVNNYCTPYHLWSSSLSSNESLAESRYLNSGWTKGEYHIGHGFSARCVKDL